MNPNPAEVLISIAAFLLFVVWPWILKRKRDKAIAAIPPPPPPKPRLPQHGDIWGANGKGGPWASDTRRVYIRDCKDGWVRYAFNWYSWATGRGHSDPGIFSDERMETEGFISIYKFSGRAENPTPEPKQ